MGLQKRNITGWKARLIQKLSIGKVYALSYSMKKSLTYLGVDAEVIYTGIEIEKFIPVDEDFNMLLDVFQIERYLNDLVWELKQEKRRNAIIPIRGILKVMQKSFIYEN